jgi:glycosyltransferase involved in cell wall biosynthesis
MPNGEPWPLVSVVMPSFNQNDFLEHAIRSVLLQGYPSLELIIIDGGSTDGSIETIERYEPWLKYCVSEPDSGPADALNRGFAVAAGDIYGFLNSDDFYLQGCLERVAHEFVSRPEVDVVSGHSYFAKATGELGMPTFSDRWNLKRFRYGACVLVQQSTFFRQRIFEKVQGFRQHTKTCWDMELWADMARMGARFHVVDAFMAAFRLHPHSITGNPEMRAQRRRDAQVVMEQMRGRPESKVDRITSIIHRSRKVSTHPHRTVRQRWFFYSTLRRWSL